MSIFCHFSSINIKVNPIKLLCFLMIYQDIQTETKALGALADVFAQDGQVLGKFVQQDNSASSR